MSLYIPRPLGSGWPASPTAAVIEAEPHSERPHSVVVSEPAEFQRRWPSVTTWNWVEVSDHHGPPRELTLQEWRQIIEQEGIER